MRISSLHVYVHALYIKYVECVNVTHEVTTPRVKCGACTVQHRCNIEREGLTVHVRGAI